jgi:PTS system sucrose-specific IIC component
MNYRDVASQILDAIGGKENVIAATHCATRLRLALKDGSKLKQESLDNMEAVKGTFLTAGQYQIILGPVIVNLVYKEFCDLTGIQEMSTQEVKNAGAENLNILQRLVKILSDIFVPIIPAIVAGGLLMGLNNVLTANDLFVAGKSLIDVYPQFNELASMINTFANAAFVFLPVLIGFSSANRFGGNPFLGATLGMLMVHPDLLNGYGYGKALLTGEIPTWNIAGFSIEKVGYQGTVLPVLAATFIMSKLEQNLRKVVPSALDIILTPLLSIFITAILTFIIVGPITRTAGNLLTDGLVLLYNSTGFIGGGIFGLIYAPIVITGMHNCFIAVETQFLSNIDQTGGSFIFPIATMSNIAQGAATLAVLFVSKNSKIKSIASASGISALLGITEPAMFGVNLKLKYPFIGAIIGSCVASAYISLNKTLAVALGAAGLPGIISIRPASMGSFMIGMFISFIISFTATVILSRKYEMNFQDKSDTSCKKSLND